MTDDRPFRRRIVAGMTRRFRRDAGSAVAREADGAGPAEERDRLWRWVLHEDDLLATRVSFFFLAQSILIAVTAAVVNTFAGLRPAHRLIRIEVFGLAVMLSLSGVALTLVFWYIFTINYNGVRVLAAQLKVLDSMYRQLDAARQEERLGHWYFRSLFRRRGVNAVINNLVPALILVIWCVVTAFAVAIFFAR